MARTILITGCSTGIGRCSALGMKARGWRVFATARKPEDIAELEAEGLDVLYLDYSKRNSIAAAVEAVFAETGGTLDALFNNGAYAQPGAIEDMPTDILRAQFETNFFGWHELTRRVIPAMRRQGHGRIVMNSSFLGFVTAGFLGAYNSTKFALEGYSDTLRIELEGSGIHVCVIEPGPIRGIVGKTAARHLRKNIAIRNSVHTARYRRALKSLEREGGYKFGELGPEAVLKALISACESRNPRPQYRVTLPTHALSLMTRIAPKRQLHSILVRTTFARATVKS